MDIEVFKMALPLVGSFLGAAFGAHFTLSRSKKEKFGMKRESSTVELLLLWKTSRIGLSKFVLSIVVNILVAQIQISMSPSEISKN
ncbi:hypothetical protein [Vibrio diabolicus]|uniref:hypothetical protein n=1 Tax=Vibrio diabolicus TaxID=50719 RepID=UPI0021604240|nr:hypothetical protein [Vibrio diabolicus]MCS0368242.1 hypothetical protein [Vibrio diabolicus]